MFDKLDQLEARYDDLGRQLGDPSLLSDQKKFQAVAKQHRDLEPTVEKFRDYRRLKQSIDEAREVLDALNERLFDRESYDVLFNLPHRDAVAAICADLGLSPDWTLWTDDAGFVAPPGRRRVDWVTLCATSFPPKDDRAKRPPPHRRQ